MTTTNSSDVYYDTYDVGINADPYPVYKRLREEAPGLASSALRRWEKAF